MKTELTPTNAWEPISENEWTAARARHFFRRASWTATPSQVGRALKLGPIETVAEAFAPPPPMPMPPSVARAAGQIPELYRKARTDSRRAKREELRIEAQQIARSAFYDMTIKWLQYASRPQNSACEKWISFLQNIFVVSYARFNNPNWLFRHHDILRRESLSNAPDLCKAVSRSAAMIIYLDLERSLTTAPNENFARELFELFTLGEGNYTEQDIKEAARAFTGYRHQNGEFRFAESAHDHGKRKVFGRTGAWKGDDVIDLIYKQKAAATFLPREMCRFYLSDRDLHPAYLETLGEIWQKSRFDLSVLIHRFFTSRIFYDSRFRGNLIKSPLHFHLGLLQDLSLTVPPFPREILVRYRQMGQDLYHPPNVRGWVGGRLWINASTLAARRMLVESLFQPSSQNQLNADELRALQKARSEGRVSLIVTRKRLEQIADAEPEIIARRFCDFFLAQPVSPGYREKLTAWLADGPGDRLDRVRTSVMAILQSPEYNLC